MWWKLCWFLCITVAVGCATVIRGAEEDFLVESDPVGAKVTLVWDEPAVLFVYDNKKTYGEEVNDPKKVPVTRLEGVTPTTFEIPRKGDFTVTISKDGYKPVTTLVKTQISTSGMVLGSCCVAPNIYDRPSVGGAIGGIGAGVDETSGGKLEHVPAAIKVKLEKIEVYKESNSTHEPPSRRGDSVDQK